MEERPTEPPTTKPKKKKKKKKKKTTTEGKGKEEVEHQPRYPWYYTIGPLALLFLTQKYIEPNLVTSLGMFIALILIAVLHPQ